jgi:hypothetical protein
MVCTVWMSFFHYWKTMSWICHEHTMKTPWNVNIPWIKPCKLVAICFMGTPWKTQNSWIFHLIAMKIPWSHMCRHEKPMNFPNPYLVNSHGPWILVSTYFHGQVMAIKNTNHGHGFNCINLMAINLVNNGHVICKSALWTCHGYEIVTCGHENNYMLLQWQWY